MSTGTQPVEESVIRELNRRRVVRVMVAYMAVCLAALSLGHVVLAHLVAGPEWGFRVLLGAAAQGFPLTAVLSWTYDITPEGIVKTPEDPLAEPAEEPAPQWAWAATVVVGVVVGVLALAADLFIF